MSKELLIVIILAIIYLAYSLYMTSYLRILIRDYNVYELGGYAPSEDADLGWIAFCWVAPIFWLFVLGTEDDHPIMKDKKLRKRFRKRLKVYLKREEKIKEK